MPDLILAGCALAMVAFYVVDRRPRMVNEAPSEAPADWRKEIETGIRVGPRTAPVTIVEFMDFQCPFCASWAARVDSLLAEFPDKVQLVFHHYPLSSHPHAVAAAVAAECALRQGKFMEFQKRLFTDRGSIGSRPWREFAVSAGVADLDSYEACVGLPADSFPRIAYGRALGKRVGVRGTPTVWINGQVERPDLAELRALLK